MPHTLLLTGATGGFGSRLLETLCGRDDVERVFALVHTSPPGALPPKVTAIAGDVTAGVDLGLSMGQIEALVADVTGVVHAAANTSFSAELAVARRTNVEGMRHVLALSAKCRRLDRVCLLSTTYVAGRRTGVILERELQHSAGFVNSYEQSKHEAELAARAWMDRLPLAVIRLSTVIGGEEDGPAVRLGAVHHAIRLMYRSLAPMVPGRGESPVDLVPAGYAVAAAAWLCTKAFEPGRTYHVCGSDDAMTQADFIDHTMEAFRRFRPAWRRRAIEPPALVDLETFDLFRRSVDQVGDSVMREATAVIGSFAPQLAYPKVFDDSACRRALDGSGIVRPSVRESYVTTIRYLVERRWGHGQPAAGDSTPILA